VTTHLDEIIAGIKGRYRNKQGGKEIKTADRSNKRRREKSRKAQCKTGLQKERRTEEIKKNNLFFLIPL
jgi:hypothetical protein